MLQYFYLINIFLGSYGGTAQATFDHPHIYSTIHGGGGGHHKSKNQSASLSALTLLAFLFFLHILTSCLKEQMTSMNPTVSLHIQLTHRLESTLIKAAT